MKLTCLKCDRDLSQVPVVYGVLKCPDCGARYSIKKDEPPIDNSGVPGAIYGSGFIDTARGGPPLGPHTLMTTPCPKCGACTVNKYTGKCGGCGYLLAIPPVMIGT